MTHPCQRCGGHPGLLMATGLGGFARLCGRCRSLGDCRWCGLRRAPEHMGACLRCRSTARGDASVVLTAAAELAAMDLATLADRARSLPERFEHDRLSAVLAAAQALADAWRAYGGGSGPA